MRVEQKPKSTSIKKTVIGSLFGSGGGFIGGILKKYFGIDIGLDTTNFDKNLDNTIVDVQKLADRVDELSIPDAQIQSDWNQNDNTKVDFIKGKPTVPTLPAGTLGQTMRKGTSVWEATNAIKVLTDVYGMQHVYFNIGTRGGANDYGFMLACENSDVSGAIQFKDGTGNLVKFLMARNSEGITVNIFSFGTYQGRSANIELRADGGIFGGRYAKYDNPVTEQLNNAIFDKTGLLEKQLKNIGIELSDVLIDNATLTEISDLSTNPYMTNYYHLDFRFIFKRLAGSSAIDVFRNSGLQFQFTNGGASDIEVLGGIAYSYYFSDGLTDQAMGAYDCINFTSATINNPDFALNSSVDAEYLIVQGSFCFLQAASENELKVKIAKVTDADDYTIEKGSFVKITLKNEG